MPRMEAVFIRVQARHGILERLPSGKFDYKLPWCANWRPLRYLLAHDWAKHAPRARCGLSRHVAKRRRNQNVMPRDDVQGRSLIKHARAAGSWAWGRMQRFCSV